MHGNNWKLYIFLEYNIGIYQKKYFFQAVYMHINYFTKKKREKLAKLLPCIIYPLY